MKNKYIRITAAILVFIQLAQFHTNKDAALSANDITLKYTIPADIHEILKRSCYDCHSNNTIYPWYSYIQPVGWWLNHHINEGKERLNFSEFSSYSPKKVNRKLEKIAKSVTAGWMPLSSYLWIHHNAQLSKEEADKVLSWSKSIQDSLQAALPPEKS